MHFEIVSFPNTLLQTALEFRFFVLLTEVLSACHAPPSPPLSELLVNVGFSSATACSGKAVPISVDGSESGSLAVSSISIATGSEGRRRVGWFRSVMSMPPRRSPGLVVGTASVHLDHFPSPNSSCASR
jgi:hypothetical protein